MTDTQLTTMATLAWLLGTVTLFILLAHWSAGGSWGISAAVARGLIGWAGRNGDGGGERYGGDDEMSRIAAPRLDQLWGTRRNRAAMGPARHHLPVAEIEDLGTRRLP